MRDRSLLPIKNSMGHKAPPQSSQSSRQSPPAGLSILLESESEYITSPYNKSLDHCSGLVTCLSKANFVEPFVSPPCVFRCMELNASLVTTFYRLYANVVY
ncbi:hypothetical protein V3C99_003421 [Haemonchus contortus]